MKQLYAWKAKYFNFVLVTVSIVCAIIGSFTAVENTIVKAHYTTIDEVKKTHFTKAYTNLPRLESIEVITKTVAISALIGAFIGWVGTWCCYGMIAIGTSTAKASDTEKASRWCVAFMWTVYICIDCANGDFFTACVKSLMMTLYFVGKEARRKFGDCNS